MERLLAAHEPPLTVAQFLALRAIAREPLSGAELAKRAGVSGAAVSQLLAGLEQAGWLERGPRPDDRRRQELALSRAGARTLDSGSNLLRERLGALLAVLPRRELDALGRGLERLESLLGGAPPPRRPPHPRPPGPRHRR
jgi:DNA-binding MarR family transcriptional regulator